MEFIVQNRIGNSDLPDQIIGCVLVLVIDLKLDEVTAFDLDLVTEEGIEGISNSLGKIGIPVTDDLDIGIR